MKKIILLILLSLILTSCEQLKYEVYDLNEDGNLVCNGNLYVKQDFDFGSEYSFNGDKIQVGVLSGLIKRGLFVSENDDGINIIEIRNNYFVKDSFKLPNIKESYISDISIGDIKITEKSFSRTDYEYIKEPVLTFENNVLFDDIFTETLDEEVRILSMRSYGIYFIMTDFDYLCYVKYNIKVVDENIYLVNPYDETENYIVNDKYLEYFKSAVLNLEKTLNE